MRPTAPPVPSKCKYVIIMNNLRKAVDELGLPDEITERIVGILGMSKRSYEYGIGLGSAGRLFDHTAPPARGGPTR